MNEEFIRRLRDPDLWGIPFRRRVTMVRAQLEYEARQRRARALRWVTHAATAIAVVAGVVAGLQLPVGRWLEDGRLAQRVESRRLERAMEELEWRVSERAWADELARARLRSEIRTYQAQRRWGHLPYGNPNGPIISQPSSMARFAFFEAFPSNGRGVGAVAPLPNWALQSEDLTTSWTTGAAAVGGIPTITANAATAPNGTLTADRLQVPACSGGVGASVLFQNFTAIPLQTYTLSVYVKGNGAAYSFALYNYNTGILTGTETVCSAVTSDYTRCTHTWTQPVNDASGRIGMGCQNDSTVTGRQALPASDVFVWGVMLNVGSTAAPYVRTTTAATGYAPAGAKNEALAFTRASSAMATKTATGGRSVTGIANGDLILMPSNQPRVEYDESGVLGFRVEASKTNNVLQSQALAGAPWADDTTVGAITATANYATAPDGSTTATRLQIPAVSAAQYAARYQAFSCPAGTDTVSAFVRAVSGTPRVDIQLNSGVNSVTALTTEWRRVIRTSSPASSTFVSIGHYGIFGGAQGAIDILVWGVQCEAGSFASSYIPTTSATVTRAADSPLTLASIALTVPFCMGATIDGPGSGLPFNGRGLVDYASAWRLDTASNASQFIRAGVGPVTAGVAASPLARHSAYRNANGTDATACTNSSCTTAALAGATPASGALAIGVTPASQPYAEGIITRVKVDLSETRCAQ